MAQPQPAVTEAESDAPVSPFASPRSVPASETPSAHSPSTHSPLPQEGAVAGTGALAATTSLAYSGRETELLQAIFTLLVQRQPETISRLFTSIRKSEHDRLAQCLVSLSFSCPTPLTLPLIEYFIREEFAASLDATVMRENAVASKIVKAYLARVGNDYLVELLQKPLGSALSPKEEYEIDTAKVETEEAMKNLPKLERKAAELIERIRESVDRLPPGLRIIAQYTAQLAREYRGLAAQAHVLVGAIIFLRYINPAIAMPEVVRGLLKPKTIIASKQRRNLVLLTKILQNLSNGMLFGGKEAYMAPLNPFVKSRQEALRLYFAQVLDFQYNPNQVHDGLALALDAADQQLFHALLFEYKEQLLEQLSGGDGAELSTLLAKLGSYQHKLSFSFLDSADQATVSRVLETRGEEARYVGYVMCKDGKKGKKKGDRPLVLVVGRYTLLLLKQGSTSARVYTETHYLDLLKVLSDEPSTFVLAFYPRLVDKSLAPAAIGATLHVASPPQVPGMFAGAAGRRTEPLTLTCTSAHTDAIVLAIRRQLRTNFPSLPPQQRCELRVTPPGRMPDETLGEEADDLPCGGLVDTYRALCVYYGTEPHGDSVWDLTHLYGRTRALDLARFTHKEVPFTERDALPLLHALGYNQYFTTLTVSHMKFDKASLQGLIQLVTCSTTLTALALSHLSFRDHSAPISLVFDAMRESQALQLTSLVLNYTELSQKDLLALAGYLTQVPSSFTKLHLAYTYTGASEPFKSFLWAVLNNSAFRHLQSLSLRGCKLEDLESEISRVLSRREALEELLLSDARVKLNRLVPTWSVLGTSLRVLDLSNQKLSDAKGDKGDKSSDGWVELCTWLAHDETRSIAELHLSNTAMGAETLAQVLKAPNDHLRLLVNASHNAFTGKEAGLLIGSALSHSNQKSVTALDLSDCPLGDEGVHALAEGLYHCHSLERLVLDRTFRPSSTKARKDAVNALIQMFQASTLPLRALSMAGAVGGKSGKSDSRLKEAVCPLLLALGRSRRLEELDVSGHSFGNTGAIQLGRLLEMTRSVRRIVWDDNYTQLIGLQAVASALTVNRSIVDMPLPVLDISRIISADDSRALFDAIATYEAKLRRNQRH